MDIVLRATKYLGQPAVNCRGRIFSYDNLLSHSTRIKEKLLQGRKDLQGERIVFLSPQSYEFIPVQWGIWQAGGIAVPLCLQHPPPEWEYVITNTQASAVVCHSSFLSQLGPLAEKNNVKLIPYGDFSNTDKAFAEATPIDGSRGAQIIYTSGTTGRPKGAVHSHKGIKAQLDSIATAWELTENDHILEVLPLHHVHGNINIVCSALHTGAKITFHPKFNAQEVWKEIIRSKDLNLIMAVPTIYSKLLEYWKVMDSSEKKVASEACKKFRVMVSGSMALPEFILNQWTDITGQTILERYGMTECGMILSNPIHGLRKPGFVGTPLPGVSVKLVNQEIRVKSDGMFTEYFRKPEETKKSFDEEGWFMTGDIASQDELGNYKIEGRDSIDIIKSGGFKISALDIENDLLAHPDIEEVSVVGYPDEMYGQIVAVVLKAKQKITLHELQNWSKERIAPYKVPRIILQLDEIPRNQMGKVNKKDLLKLIKKEVG